MRAPRCVSAFPITNLKRRRLRQSSPPLPSFSSSPPAAFPFSPLAPPPSLFFPSPHRHRLRGRMAACQLQLAIAAAYLRREREKKENERKEKRRKEKERKDRGAGSAGAIERMERGLGGDRKTRRKFESDSFRPVKPITVFARLITRNRVNCKLTRLVPTKRGETFENLKRQLDRLSRRSTFLSKSDRYAGSTPPGSYMALPVKNYCFSVYRFSRGRSASSILPDFQPFHVHPPSHPQ